MWRVQNSICLWVARQQFVVTILHRDSCVCEDCELERALYGIFHTNDEPTEAKTEPV